VKFSALFFLSFFLFSTSTFARETFDFDLGQKINVLSDKAFRKTSDDEFEAVGNVVITHLKNSIYGEKAVINFTTGETEVMGNVRYIAPEMTLYGTKLNYNFIGRQINLENARVYSDNFIITGKKIIQNSPGVIYAEEAEYTTCKDCPESWSVFAKKITITVGQYVRLQNAFIKINGVTAMYFPYLIFPIKKKRETGVLFPSISFSGSEGFQYMQPFFWVIDDYKDATLTPSTFGKRGLGGELQYRQNIKEKTWFEVNTLQLNDKIYEPNKVDKTLSGHAEYRQFSDFEGHFAKNKSYNGHIYFNDTSDLDTVRDFDYFAREKLRGSEIGGGGFLEARSSLFSLGVESYYNQNMLISDPRKFDDSYVQILPKINFSSTPYNLVHTNYPFLKNIALGLNTDYTVFKQNKVDLTGPIRNAQRINFGPYLDWQLGNLGPIFFSHQLKFDYQNYRLPTEQDKNFSKKGLIYETEAKIELEKIYGLSYMEERPAVIDKKNSNEKANGGLLTATPVEPTTIGVLPKVGANTDEQTTLVYNNSYRHSQEFILKHYYLGEQDYHGNRNFRDQIESDDGQFDYVDALRDREHLANQTTAQDSLPISNTIELQWNNNLIRKTSKKFDPYKDNQYLKDNFLYSNITFFEVSQGVDLTVNSDRMIDKLTRLYINTGVNLDRVGLALQEFYFHKSGEHKLAASTSLNFDHLSIAGNFTYNSFNSVNTPITKLIGYNFTLNLNDLITLKNSLDYNIQSKVISQSTYSVLYAPINNCWKIEVNYARDLIDSRVGLLVYINYNSNNFSSINVIR
jgi:LPS-assembly protein